MTEKTNLRDSLAEAARQVAEAGLGDALAYTHRGGAPAAIRGFACAPSRTEARRGGGLDEATSLVFVVPRQTGFSPSPQTMNVTIGDEIVYESTVYRIVGWSNPDGLGAVYRLAAAMVRRLASGPMG